MGCYVEFRQEKIYDYVRMLTISEMDNNSSTPNKESHNKKVNKSTVKTTGVKKQE